MHDVKIYGEIVPFQDTWIIENGYCNLTEVQRQLKEANGSDIRVRFNSVGGDVDEGFAIYAELRRYAKENNAKITTLSEGRCASIATIPFLAGDTRIVNEYSEPFIHNAWTYAMGDAKTLLRVAVDLELVNDKIAKFYANHTDLTVEGARALMEAETSISADECKALRFATEIEYAMRPAALQKIINLKANTMAKNTKRAGFLSKIMREIGLVSNKELFDATNEVVDFYELEDDETPKIGDKASYKGDRNYTGEIEMSTGETWTFDNGTLTSKGEDAKNEEAPETLEEVTEVIVELQAEIEELKTDVEDVKEELDEAVEVMASMLKSYKAMKKENDSFKAKMNKTSKSFDNKKEANSKVGDVALNFRKNRKK